MTITYRHALRVALCAAIGVFALNHVSNSVGAALAAGKSKAEAKPDSKGPNSKASDSKGADAQNALAAGQKAFAAGQYQPAIDQFSAALRGGGLAGADMAKALYLRGVAYKKQGKAGLAISDLTSALWLKNGLSADDRAAATAERAEAYKMAGLDGAGAGGDERIKAAATEKAKTKTAEAKSAAAKAVDSKVSNAKAAVAETAPAVAASQGADAAAQASNLQAQTVTRQSPDSEAAKEAALARAAAANPVETGGLGMAAVAGLVRDPAPAAAEAPVASAVVDTPQPATSPGPVFSAMPGDTGGSAVATSPSGGIGGFFSNLFGSGNATPAQSVTTASTTPASPPAAQASSWSDTVSVAEPAGSRKAAARSDAVKTAVAAGAQKTVVPKGKYKVHIAAMRSRADAEALAQKVNAAYGADLANRTPTVDEAVIGSMGTFYRVRIGGYATQDEPRGLCNKLRSGGFDCLVVTN